VGCGRPKERDQVSTVAPRLFYMKFHNPGGKKLSGFFVYKKIEAKQKIAWTIKT